MKSGLYLGGWMKIRYLAILAAVLFVAGCVQPQTQGFKFNRMTTENEAKKQRAVVAKVNYDAQQRVYRVGAPILYGAVSMCKNKQGKDLGFNVWNRFLESEPKWSAALATAYGLDKELVINVVAPGGPADRAGLKAGDEVTALGQWNLPKGVNARSFYLEKLSALAKTRARFVKVETLRKGKKKVSNIEWQLVCDYAISADMNSQNASIVNAYATGNKMVVTKGMLRFVDTDDELALVLSHEFAHNAMGHIKALEQNQNAGAAGGFVVDMMFAVLGVNTGGAFSEKGAAIGANAYTLDFESEADYAGLYAMAMAGGNIEVAPDFWRKMAAEAPGNIEMAVTHPTTPARALALEKTIAEIKLKIKSGQPLTPNLKPKPPTNTPATPTAQQKNTDLN